MPWSATPCWPVHNGAAPPVHLAQPHVPSHPLSSQLPLDAQFQADVHRMMMTLQSSRAQELSRPSAATQVKATAPSSTVQPVKEPSVGTTAPQAPARRLPGATSKLELATAEALKLLFGPDADFKKVRPDWLINPENGKHRLELDLAGKVQLGGKLVEIALEVDGQHHTSYPSRFYPLGFRAEYNRMRKRDLSKELICARRGVILIRVPHSLRCDPSDVLAFLKEEFEYRGIQLPTGSS